MAFGSAPLLNGLLDFGVQIPGPIPTKPGKTRVGQHVPGGWGKRTAWTRGELGKEQAEVYTY